MDISELITLALALDVAPVHFLAPVEEDRLVMLTPARTTSAKQVRLFVRGESPPDGVDPRKYFSQVPLSEFRAAVDTLTVRKDG